MGACLACMALPMGKDIAYDVEDGSWMGIPSPDSLLAVRLRLAPTLVAQGGANIAIRNITDQ